MQKDFHYCATYALAVEAGFTRPDAAIIAYASQYVDDATEGEPVALPGGQIFDAVRTAHLGLQSFDWDVQKKIYMPFHFLPNVMRREHRRRFSYVTRPARLDAEPRCLAQLLFEQAADEPDARLRLVRLGVALHAVADTFAHCGFSGRQGSENDVEAIETARDGGSAATRPCRPTIPRRGAARRWAATSVGTGRLGRDRRACWLGSRPNLASSARSGRSSTAPLFCSARGCGSGSTERTPVRTGLDHCVMRTFRERFTA